jgi:beta-lactamase class D
MRKFLLLVAFALLTVPVCAQRITEKDFKPYFDVQGIEGSFLLYDLKQNRYTAYDLARCRRGFLPASTFKIPNSIIGLETGVVTDTSQVFKWDGQTRDIAAWNRDLTLAEAIRVSCVPCYQQIARQVGAQRYRQYLTKLKFGKMDVHPENVDQFWLRGSSRITQFEQLDFLKRLQQNQLPVSRRNTDLTKAILVLAKGPGWVLCGKTGWATPDVRPDGTWNPGARDIGWFVGWLEQGGNAYFFATSVEAPRPVPGTWAAARRGITEQILRNEFGLMQP